MDQRIIDLYDDYVHVHFDRRLFLQRASEIVGGMSAAAALLPVLRSDYARAEVVSPKDPRLETRRVTFAAGGADVKAYFARPTADGRRGGILVAHQNRGLNPHIEDIARRLAVAGFDALAVDFLSTLGGTPADEDRAMAMFRDLDPAKVDIEGQAALAWLSAQPDANGATAVIGFCWGGGVANRLATEDPKLNAAVIYYGEPPPAQAVAGIHAKLLLNYADPDLDRRLGSQIPSFEKALRSHSVDYRLYLYKGANHAFNDDTNAARYDKPAADLAWSRTLSFLKANVSS